MFFKLWSITQSYLRKAEGATAVEYGIMVAFIAAVIIGTVALLGPRVMELFKTVLSNEF